MAPLLPTLGSGSAPALPVVGTITAGMVLKTALGIGTYKAEAGQAYQDYMRAKDIYGNPLYTREEALNHGRRVGGLNAAIEVLGFGFFLKGAGRILGKDTIKTILSNEKAKEKILEAGREGLKKRTFANIAKGTAEMTLPEVLEEGAQTAVSDIDENIFGKKSHAIGEMVDDVAKSMFQALPAALGMALPGAGAGGMLLHRKIKKLAEDQGGLLREQLKREAEQQMTRDILEARGESKYEKTAPGTFGQIVQNQMNKNGKEYVYIDAASAAETEKGQAAIGELIDKNVVMQEEVNEAIKEGAPLKIQSGMYMQTISEDAADTLSEHSTFDEDGKTLHDIQTMIQIFDAKQSIHQAEKEKREADVAEEILKDETLEDDQKDMLGKVLAEGMDDIEGNYHKLKKEAEKAYQSLDEEAIIKEYKDGHMTDEEYQRAMEDVKKAKADYDTLSGLESYIQKMDKDDIKARTLMSEEAYQKIYRPVKVLLQQTTNKTAEAARDTAFLYARMVENFAKQYGRTIDDILPEIQNGSRSTKADGYGQAMFDVRKAGINNLSDFYKRIKERKEKGEAPNKIKYTDKNGVTYAESQVTHAVNEHILSTEELSDIEKHIGEIYDCAISDWAQGEYKGRFNGKSVIGRIDGELSSYYVCLEFTPDGQVWFKTAAKGTKEGIHKKIEERSAGRLSSSKKKTQGTTGHNLSSSISIIQKELGIVKKDNLYQRLAPHEVEGYTADELAVTATITGDEFGQYKDIKELRTKALTYYKENLQGTFVHNDLLGDIRLGEDAIIKEGEPGDVKFTGTGRKEMGHSSGNIMKLLSIYKLKEIMENANIVGKSSSQKEKHNGWMFYYLHSAIDTPDGKQYVVVTVVDKGKGTVDYYNHNVFAKEMYTGIKKTAPTTLGKGFTKTPKELPKAAFSNPIIYEAEEIYKREKIYNQKAYHGSPYTFKRFDLGAIGTGEGGQAHGWGLYFAKDRKVAAHYRILKDHNMNYKGQPIGKLRDDLERKKDWDKLSIVDDFINEQDISRMDMSNYEEATVDWFKKEIYPNIERQSSLLEVDIPDNEYLLNKDVPLGKQSQKVKEGIVAYYKSRPDDYISVSADELGDATGDSFYEEVVFQMKREGSNTPEKDASLLLNKLGIKGLAYHGGRDGQCFVVFDDKAIKTINRYNQTVNQGTIAEVNLTRDEVAWSKNIDAVENGDVIKGSIHVMNTPLVMQMLGIGNLPIQIDVSKLNKIKNEHPEMTASVLKQIPRALTNPIMISRSKTVPGRIVVALDIKGENGVNVVVPFVLNTDKKGIKANIIASAYSRKKASDFYAIDHQWFINNVNGGSLLYADRSRLPTLLGLNKKNTTALLKRAAVQFRLRNKSNNGISVNRILNETDLVKLKNENPEYYQKRDKYAGAYNRTENVIHLFEAANQSTLLHEAAHWWLSMLDDMYHDPELQRRAETDEGLKKTLVKRV